MSCTKYWPFYEQLEEELGQFTFSISLDDHQKDVYSTRLGSLIQRCAAEAENASNAIIQDRGFSVPGQTNFPGLGASICPMLKLHKKELELVWPYCDLSSRKLAPLAGWDAGNPTWFTANNKYKHDRQQHMPLFSIWNAVNAVGAVFILNLWLRRDEIEAERRWVQLTSDYVGSFSKFFSPASFLTSSAGGVYRTFKLDET